MTVNSRYKPKYHINVPEAWSNDPNGLIWYQNRVHFFCQYYPHATHWGTMHWAHFVSDDMVKWEFLPPALYPDMPYEAICGCCSGSSIEIDGKLLLMYTAAQPELQRQCLAWADDGIHFKKVPENPVLTSTMLDDVVSPRDFRDPKLFKRGGYYYCLAGVRVIDREKYNRRAAAIKAFETEQEEEFYEAEFYINLQGLSPSSGLHPISSIPVLGVEEDAIGYGNLTLFRTKDLKNWEFCGILLDKTEGFDEAFFKLDGVYECPDYFVSNGADIILASPQNLPQMGNRFQNHHSVVYLKGKLDFETGHFDLHEIEDLDSGFDIYASQSFRMPDGRQILIAWKEMWDRSFPTAEDGWVGTYTLPRELEYKDGRLYQTPIRELEAYRSDKQEVSDIQLSGNSVQCEGFAGNCLETEVTFKMNDAGTAGIKVFCGREHETVIYYDRSEGTVVFDRRNGGIPLTGSEPEVNIRRCDVGDCDTVTFRVFLDVASAEVFINGGRYVMTGNVFPDPEDTGIEFFSDGNACVTRAVKYSLMEEKEQESTEGRY